VFLRVTLKYDFWLLGCSNIVLPADIRFVSADLALRNEMFYQQFTVDFPFPGIGITPDGISSSKPGDHRPIWLSDPMIQKRFVVTKLLALVTA
jgi:hypothetical protein